MKVRISGNSIRFRLKQSEVALFRKAGQIREVTAFGVGDTDKLSFALKTSPSNYFQIDFVSCTVDLHIPQSICKEWTETDLVGFEESIDTEKGEAIKVLVEKDFKCIDGSDKENEDAYPNPNISC